MKTRLAQLVRRMAGVAAIGCTAAFAVDCFATVRPAYVDGVAVYYDDDGAYEYDTYPRYVWNGRNVYLVGDRWYYRSPHGWAYFRDEPPALYHHRHGYYSGYGYSAPPAYGVAPPARRYAPPPRRGPVAPPAHPHH
jgi:hypothetical protein